MAPGISTLTYLLTYLHELKQLQMLSCRRCVVVVYLALLVAATVVEYITQTHRHTLNEILKCNYYCYNKTDKEVKIKTSHPLSPLTAFHYEAPQALFSDRPLVCWQLLGRFSFS